MIINAASNTPFSAFYVIFRGSVANENYSNYGISHLMEHLQCKNFDHMLSDFTSSGIDWNAYTNDNYIIFYLSGLEKYVSPFRKEYIKNLLQFNVTKPMLENEINIVLQEYANCFTSQRESHYLNFFRKNYNYFGPIGSKRAIQGITLDDCREFYELQYKKPHMIINISSSFFEESVDFQEKTNVLHLSGDYRIDELEFHSKFDTTSSVQNYSLVNEDMKELKFISSILSHGLESPLYKRIREEKGLVYFIHMNCEVLSEDQGFLSISSEMEDKNVSEFQKTVKEILAEDITQERFEVIKKAEKVNLEKKMVLNHGDIGRYLNPKTYIDLDFIENINLDDLNRIKNKHLPYLSESIDKEEFAEWLN